VPDQPHNPVPVTCHKLTPRRVVLARLGGHRLSQILICGVRERILFRRRVPAFSTHRRCPPFHRVTTAQFTAYDPASPNDVSRHPERGASCPPHIQRGVSPSPGDQF